MTTLKRKMLIFGAGLILMISGFAIIANAELDGQNDIYHHTVMVDGETWDYELYTGAAKADIDIKEITSSNDGTTLTVTLEVDGTIQEDAKHTYIYYYNTSDATYIFSISMGVPGVAVGYTWEAFNDLENLDFEELFSSMKMGTFSADGSILTGEIELFGETEATDEFAVATEYETDLGVSTDPTNIEFWVDYAPGTYAPFYGTIDDDGGDGDGDTGDGDGDGDTGDGDTGDGTTTDSGDDGTPGFELIVLIAAIAIALISFRRKK